MRALVTFADEIAECCNYLETEQTAELQHRQMISSIKQFQAEERKMKMSVGAMRMDRIRHLISNLPGYTLSYFQRKGMDEMLRCVAPSIFADCDPDEMALYFEKNRWEPAEHKMMFMQTSRRAGKTDALTILAAALLVVVPNITLMCWSLFNDTSAFFGKTVVRWMLDMGCSDRKILHDKKRILMFGDGDNDERELTLLGAQNPNVSFFCLFFFVLSLSPSPVHVHRKKKKKQRKKEGKQMPFLIRQRQRTRRRRPPQWRHQQRHRLPGAVEPVTERPAAWT